MDETAVRRATSPFFSAKPAGRKRGMGLAYASRLIRLNRRALEIQRQPEHGTTVTVTLPYEWTAQSPKYSCSYRNSVQNT